MDSFILVFIWVIPFECYVNNQEHRHHAANRHSPSTYTHTHLEMHTRKESKNPHRHSQPQTHTQTHAHTRTHTCTHTNSHTHTHTCTHTHTNTAAATPEEFIFHRWCEKMCFHSDTLMKLSASLRSHILSTSFSSIGHLSRSLSLSPIHPRCSVHRGHFCRPSPPQILGWTTDTAGGRVTPCFLFRHQDILPKINNFKLMKLSWG